jgi:hypothetical protein
MSSDQWSVVSGQCPVVEKQYLLIVLAAGFAQQQQCSKAPGDYPIKRNCSDGAEFGGPVFQFNGNRQE